MSTIPYEPDPGFCLVRGINYSGTWEYIPSQPPDEKSLLKQGYPAFWIFRLDDIYLHPDYKGKMEEDEEFLPIELFDHIDEDDIDYYSQYIKYIYGWMSSERGKYVPTTTVNVKPAKP